jgi:hypothetical protein
MAMLFIFYLNQLLQHTQVRLFGQIAQVVEHQPLDYEVRGSNLSHDTMGRHYEFPLCGIIKGKILLLLKKNPVKLMKLYCHEI